MCPRVRVEAGIHLEPRGYDAVPLMGDENGQRKMLGPMEGGNTSGPFVTHALNGKGLLKKLPTKARPSKSGSENLPGICGCELHPRLP